MLLETIPPTLTREQMRYWLLRPDQRLAPVVHCYFVVDGGGKPYHRDELLLPDGYAEIVFAFNAGYHRWGVGEATRRDVMRRSYIIGGRSHSVCTSGSHRSPRLYLVGVKLDPRFLRQLIRTPLDEFCDATLGLDDLNNAALLALEDAVAQPRSIGGILQTLNRFFLNALRNPLPKDAAVDHLLRDIHAHRGSVSIERFARDVPLDARTLARRFSASVGMTPKKYARIVRFKHSYHRLIASAGNKRLADHLDGYYDQSHFNKEFRHFTGAAPSDLLASRLASSTAITEHLLRGDLSLRA
jgi:AraC-like DNA-binding protein